jgi:hypothetical protein
VAFPDDGSASPDDERIAVRDRRAGQRRRQSVAIAHSGPQRSFVWDVAAPPTRRASRATSRRGWAWPTNEEGYFRVAASADFASAVAAAKNSCDWPVKSPLAARPLTAPSAAPTVSVGRMIEQFGNLRSMKAVGSGMIRLVFSVSPPAFRLGNSIQGGAG